MEIRNGRGDQTVNLYSLLSVPFVWLSEWKQYQKNPKTDNSGIIPKKISFVEFIEGLAKLSMGGSEADKLRFCFDIYDEDGDGKISA